MSLITTLGFSQTNSSSVSIFGLSEGFGSSGFSIGFSGSTGSSITKSFIYKVSIPFKNVS